MSAEAMPILSGAIPAFEMFMSKWEQLAKINKRLRGQKTREYCERGKVLGTDTTLGEFDGRMIGLIDLWMGSRSQRMSERVEG
jgi:hypothetical protein